MKTVSVYDRARIEWCKQHPELLSKRQREQARALPETCGAMPSLVLSRASDAEADQYAALHKAAGSLVIVDAL